MNTRDFHQPCVSQGLHKKIKVLTVHTTMESLICPGIYVSTSCVKEMLHKTDLCQCNMKASEFENKDLDTNHHQGALTHNTSHILDLDLCKCVYCMSQQ